MTDTAPPESPPESITDAPLKTPDMRLDGLVAVVTGAGRGIGRACACAVAGACPTTRRALTSSAAASSPTPC